MRGAKTYCRGKVWSGGTLCPGFSKEDGFLNLALITESCHVPFLQ
jgi:hypothetical protein